MTENELMDFLSEHKYKYTMAIFTDRADFVTDISSAEKLLEVRMFDENGEFRAYRDTVGTDFKYREITDESIFDGNYDENQYLDIDTNYTFEDVTEKQATGGGRFHLPEDAKTKTMLQIRYYYKFDDEDLAQKCDWRMVGFDDKEVF